jgi:hypothetical protein
LEALKAPSPFSESDLARLLGTTSTDRPAFAWRNHN